MWTYELVDTREDVRLGMPAGSKVEVYKVTSGDSGKKYYVQRVRIESGEFYLCQCPEGTFRAPLGILRVVKDVCKHAGNLAQFLKEKKR